MRKSKSVKYLYAVLELKNWITNAPVVYRTKTELVKHLGLTNTRKVDKWFQDSWVYMGLSDKIVAKLPIPKIKSKIRK